MSSGLGTLSGRRRPRRSPILPILSILFIIGAVGLFVFELISFSQREERLSADLIVAGIDVGTLSEGEAIAEIEQAYAEPVVLYYGDSPILLRPDAIGFRISNETLLAEARSSSQTAGSFWLRFFNYLAGQENTQTREIELGGAASYQDFLLRNILEDIAARYDQKPGEAGYDTATLTTFPGTPGSQLNIDAAIQAVDQALRRADNRVVDLPLENVTAPQPSLDTLQSLIIDYLDSQGFIYDGQSTVASIFIMDLTTGGEINILGDVTFSAASTIKMGILIDFYRYLTFNPTQEEAWLMANSLLCSNNSSSNLIMQIIGGNDLFAGIASVTSTIQFLGAENTYITAPFVLGVAGQQFGSNPAPATSPNPSYNTNPDPFNQTTAEDMGTLFMLVYDCAEHGSGLIAAYPDGEFTQRECKQMLELMSANNLLRLLQAGLPENTRISHKNGWIFDTVGDTGIVFPDNGRNYVISVYLWEQTEFQDYEKLWPLVEEISRAAWNYFSPDEALLTRRTDIPPTAQECEGNYLPPSPDQVNLDDIDSWRNP